MNEQKNSLDWDRVYQKTNEQKNFLDWYRVYVSGFRVCEGINLRNRDDAVTIAYNFLMAGYNDVLIVTPISVFNKNDIDSLYNGM